MEARCVVLVMQERSALWACVINLSQHQVEGIQRWVDCFGGRGGMATSFGVEWERGKDGMGDGEGGGGEEEEKDVSKISDCTAG